MFFVAEYFSISSFFPTQLPFFGKNNIFLNIYQFDSKDLVLVLIFSCEAVEYRQTKINTDRS